MASFKSILKTEKSALNEEQINKTCDSDNKPQTISEILPPEETFNDVVTDPNVLPDSQSSPSFEEDPKPQNNGSSNIFVLLFMVVSIFLRLYLELLS